MPDSNTPLFDQPLTHPQPAKTTRLVWLSVALILATAVVLLATAVTIIVFPAEAHREMTRSQVEHTHQVILATNNMLASATDAETGQRGFLLTDDTRYLEPYDDGTRNIWRQFSIIQKLVADNLNQQRRLTVLHHQLDAKLAELAQTIDLARNDNYDAALDLVRSGQGKVFMDAIRMTIADMVAEENRLLEVRQFEQENARRYSNQIFIMLVVLGMFGILLSGGTAIWAVSAVRTRKRRSAAATAERLRLLNMLDLAPIMVRDFDDNIWFWSQGCQRLFGWSAEEAMERPAHVLLETVFSVPRDEIDADLLDRYEWSGELRCRTQGGRPVILLAHKLLQRNANGSLGVIETFVDVTELRRSEADLRASEARMSLFIENVPAAIAMFDTAMCYIAVSRRFVIDFHLDEQTQVTLIGRCHYDLFPDISDHRRAIHSRVLAGETASSEAEPIPRADGRVDWVRWEMVPWRDANGAIGGVLLFLEDMTERREAEAALRDSEARLRLVQQVGGLAFTDRTLPEPMALISGEFADIYGLPPGQKRLPAADIVAMVHPDDRERIAAITPLSLSRDGVHAMEFRICRPDKTVRWISLRAEAFIGPTGSPQRVISAQRDITEIVAAREILAARRDELERSNADLEEFAYAVAHDLKAPLRAVEHLAQWIAEDMKGTAAPETTENLILLQERVVRMRKLLEGLLDYSRAEHMDKATADVSIGALITDIIAMHAPPPGFVITYEGKVSTLRTQRIALQMVLKNLIGNGVKHHDRDQGRIVVSSTWLANGLIEFSVSDDGPGIPEQFHKKVFGMFQTLVSRDDLESSGIGLAIVKRKVEGHGGQIWVKSAPPARGTTFLFTWKETVVEQGASAISHVKAPLWLDHDQRDAGGSAIPADPAMPPKRYSFSPSE